MRTHNKFAPFPEEVNRQVTGVLTDLHFAPTEAARQNLLREGVAAAAIHVTGNTAVDAGAVILVGTDRKKIVSETARLLDNKHAYYVMSRAHNPYGGGNAAVRIKPVQ